MKAWLFLFSADGEEGASVPEGVGDPQTPYKGESMAGVKRPGREAHYSHPFSAVM